MAASTHQGEEEALIGVHKTVCESLPDTLLILVPRHPERFASVKALLERHELSHVARSSGDACTADTRVFLGDTMGELTTFYAASDVAFVAGSLTPVGGHNLLEPAALGLPVLTGPHNFNAEDIADLLVDQGAARIVVDADDIAEAVRGFLTDKDKRARVGALGRSTVRDNRGALRRLLDLIRPLLDASTDQAERTSDTEPPTGAGPRA